MEYCDGFFIANSDLYHHGILGQKWGVTNGPPYPLNDSDHSSAERKAGWKKSLKGGAKAAGRLAASGAKAGGRVLAKGARKIGEAGGEAIKREANRAKQRMEVRREIKNNIRDRVNDNIYRDKMERKYGKIEKDYYKKTSSEEKEITPKDIAKAALLPPPFGTALAGSRAMKYYKNNLQDPNKTSANQRHRMSDEELDARYNRIKKENDLRRLESENIDAGRAFMESTGKDIASTVVKTAATGAALYAGKAIISQNFSASELGDAVFRGGAKKK